uniref:Uncharacterized protein n=1 Tax=Rhizophora mucronata TaxID=61149 RepID=A0A2P2N618_RHIMU
MEPINYQLEQVHSCHHQQPAQEACLVSTMPTSLA